MQDDNSQQDPVVAEKSQVPADMASEPHEGILNQTFGEVLQNKEAQERIMKAMHIGPDQLQQLLKTTENNPLTGMTMGQLFNSGFVQKAVQAQGGSVQPEGQEQIPMEEPVVQEGQEVVDPSAIEQSEEQASVPQESEEQLTPEQIQQLVNTQGAQVVETDEQGNPTKILVQQQPQSFFQKLMGLFK